jgi:hypothetical protein
LGTATGILFFLDKQETAFSIHNVAHFIDGVSPAFKSHPATAVGKIRVPGNIIKNAVMAINTHKKILE